MALGFEPTSDGLHVWHLFQYLPSDFPSSWFCNQQPLQTSLSGCEELTADEEKG